MFETILWNTFFAKTCPMNIGLHLEDTGSGFTFKKKGIAIQKKKSIKNSTYQQLYCLLTYGKLFI